MLTMPDDRPELKHLLKKEMSLAQLIKVISPFHVTSLYMSYNDVIRHYFIAGFASVWSESVS